MFEFEKLDLCRRNGETLCMQDEVGIVNNKIKHQSTSMEFIFKIIHIYSYLFIHVEILEVLL